MDHEAGTGRPPSWRCGALALAILALEAVRLAAYDGPVEKKTFTLSTYTTLGGRTLRDVRVGYETYGTLAPARDNVVFVPQPFSATSHAAGRYRAGDAEAGYWDEIIGSGRAIDTGRFFVISADTLTNLNVGDPDVVTTGPASLDPATGRPYGLGFPVVTLRDFVEVHRRLLDSLGIARIHAVVGASMGAMQAFEWAASYPDRVERIVVVAGTPGADAWTIAWAHAWTAPIRLDPRWRGGDYYGRVEPTEGVAAALRMAFLQMRHPAFLEASFGRRWAEPGRDPAADLGGLFAVERWLDEAVRERARSIDANSFLYMAKAIQLFVAGHGPSVEAGLAKVRARTLLLPAASDQLLPPEHLRRARRVLEARGTETSYQEIPGNGGHSDDVARIGAVADTIRAFLED